MDIVAAYQQVGTYRGAAEICGTTHKTVRRVIERAQGALAGEPTGRGSVERVRGPRVRNYDGIVDLVAERVAASRGKISAKRLLPIAVAAGYGGSGRNFRRLVTQQKSLWRSQNARHQRRPAVWTPGEYLVIDWAGTVGGLHLFCAVLAWSRWRFVAFAADEKATTTLALVAAAFAAAGGVPGKVLSDRMACLKGGVVAGVVVPAPAYVRFASHYGFSPDFCHAADPASKGIVENLVGYAQRDLLTPLLTDAALSSDGSGGGAAVDLAAANVAATAWMAEVNTAVHSQIAAVPAERLLAERDVLAPLPSMRLRLGPDPVTRKVDRLSCVRFGSARYSVPNRLVGVTVWVIPDGATLNIVDPATGELVGDHVLVAPGEVSIHDDHYDGPRKPPSRGPRPRTVAEQQFCALGEVAEAFIVGAAAAGNTRLGPELDILLALAAAHGPDQFTPALTRAVAFNRFRADDVRSILAAGTGAPTPVPAGGALVLELPTAPTRDLSAYRLQNYSSDQPDDHSSQEQTR
jgi:hypothetical protein